VLPRTHLNCEEHGTSHSSFVNLPISVAVAKVFCATARLNASKGTPG
jgi:hypothetical protein